MPDTTAPKATAPDTTGGGRPAAAPADPAWGLRPRVGVGGTAIAAFAGLAWWPAAVTLARHAGLGDASAPLALAAALLLASHVWRSQAREGLRRAQTAGRCPRCGTGLSTAHLHAAAGALASGLDTARCDACHWEHTAPLTCPECPT